MKETHSTIGIREAGNVRVDGITLRQLLLILIGSSLGFSAIIALASNIPGPHK